MTSTRTTFAALAVAAIGMTGCMLRKSAEDISGVGTAISVNQHADLTGATVQGVAGVGGVQIEAELVGQRVHRAEDPEGQTHAALGAGLGVRASLLGILADDHRLERYFDAGASAGVIGTVVRAPPDFLALRGDSYYGGWTELGLSSSGDGYLALTGELRVSDATETWDDVPLQVMVGLAWRQRSKSTPGRWRD